MALTFYLLLASVLVSALMPAVSAGIVWERKFGGSAPDVAGVVCLSTDGGAVIGGNSFSAPAAGKSAALHGAGDFWIVKVDSAGSKQWDLSFGGADFERLNAVRQTSDGGYVLAGCTYSSASGSKTSPAFGGGDIWVVKVSAAGVQQWERTFGGTNFDTATVVRQTADGGYIVGGMSSSAVSGNKASAAFGVDTTDYWILKLDGTGNKQWERSYGGADAEELQAIEQTADGGYIVGGHSFSGVSGNKASPAIAAGTSDYWILKLDASGGRVWERVEGGDDAESLGTVQQTRDSGFIVGGSSYSGATGTKTAGTHGSHDYWVVKLNGSGGRQWDASFGGTDADELYSISQAPDGGYLLGGVSVSPVSGAKAAANGIELGEYWILKIDSSGAKQWDQVVNAGFPAQVLRAELMDDASILIPGISTAPFAADPDYSVVKLAGPLQLRSPGITAPANLFRTSFAAVPGAVYVLEATTDLVNWSPVQTSQALSNLMELTHISGAGAKMRFYRVRQQ